ncbi:DUF6090 family protein [uncultured Croceitalea sp.]|uniref:DUF6090 family protein n=1 Tax=uncultured Croceitalea sp. TaxID=1798908 RepID=UPI003305AB21
MPKVFRKFRKGVLNEGRLGKYLLYAIGEIILVVVGILIALQISKYNTTVKERKEEYRLLQKFSADFRQDSLSLTYLIGSEREVLQSIDSIFRIFETGDDRYLSTIAQISQKIPNSNIFFTEAGTFEEAIAAGKMDFIVNDTLREAIFNYYGEVRVNLSDAIFDKYQTGEIVPTFFETMFQTQQGMSFIGLQNPYLPKLSIKNLYQNPEFNKILAWRKIIAGYSSGTWEQYLANCSKILQEVNAEIERSTND